MQRGEKFLSTLEGQPGRIGIEVELILVWQARSVVICKEQTIHANAAGPERCRQRM